MRFGLIGAACLAALLTLAAPGAAQQIWVPRLGLTIAPFAGYSFARTQAGSVEVDLGVGAVPGRLESFTEGGGLGGITVEAPLQSFLALPNVQGVHMVAAVAYGKQAGGTTTMTFAGEADDEQQVIRTEQGTHGVLVARLGLGLEVPVALPTVLTIAPALVRIIPERVPDDAMDRVRASNHPGVNLGLEVGLPTMLPAFQVRAGLEDFITFPGGELAGRVDRFFAVEMGMDTRTRLPRKAAHLPLLRLGFSLQL